MALELKDLCPTFSSIANTGFKRKVYDSYVLFAMENYNNLKVAYSKDMFPAKQYYTLEDQNKGVKTTQKPAGPPKKKRTPIRKISDNSFNTVGIGKELAVQRDFTLNTYKGFLNKLGLS